MSKSLSQLTTACKELTDSIESVQDWNGTDVGKRLTQLENAMNDHQVEMNQLVADINLCIKIATRIKGVRRRKCTDSGSTGLIEYLDGRISAFETTLEKLSRILDLE